MPMRWKAPKFTNTAKRCQPHPLATPATSHDRWFYVRMDIAAWYGNLNCRTESKPDNTPCMESITIETMSNGVSCANFFIMEWLSLKKPAQISCPKAKVRTTMSARRMESLSVTVIACFAQFGFPAPNSFDTLVLGKTTTLSQYIFYNLIFKAWICIFP